MNILLAHGSPDQSHIVQVQALAKQVSHVLGEEVGSAFLDDEIVPEGARLLPLFVGDGKHVREDLPKLAEKFSCTLLPGLNQYSQTLAGFAYDFATVESRRINALFAVYSFDAYESLVAALHAQNRRCSLVALASLHSEPSLKTVLQHWKNEGISAISLQAMVLFEGKTMNRLAAIADEFSISINPVLSKHPDFSALISNCLKEK
ncbi:MAG: hypothetical protein Q9M31_03055 [Mariprofundus sp.]|nr:hypothetical protein [Mariprofundus sp.]